MKKTKKREVIETNPVEDCVKQSKSTMPQIEASDLQTDTSNIGADNQIKNKKFNRANCKTLNNGKITWQLSAAYISKLSLLTAIAFVLYAFVKFPLPFLFPSFLEIQISELPALLAGFSMGPISGCIVIVLKCLFKLPLSSTFYVGELTDILLGILFVLPASLIYRYKKNKKHAAIGLLVGALLATVGAIIINRFVSIPIYIKLLFEGNWDGLLGMVSTLYPSVTKETFYGFYLGIGVLPFNLLRYLIVGGVTFIVYKKLSKILHWDGSSLKRTKISGDYDSLSETETCKIAELVAKTLNGGEKIILNGDLGAGKTAFTKGLAKALGITQEVTSPTFTILNVYESGRLTLNHLDMYRIEDESELAELGIEDVLSDEKSVSVIEWNKFKSLTGRTVNVNIEYIAENERFLKITDSADANKVASKVKRKRV